MNRRNRRNPDLLPDAPGRYWRLVLLLLGLFMGQAAMQVHAMDHALADGDPVCEVCVISHATALAGSGGGILPEKQPVIAVLPPQPIRPQAVRTAAAARDPPSPALS
ncbi:hypothetical protein [Thiohalorhabdus methylotrophus]|uniref:Uncharacterized protein n=1 Tax=Thiohalorhabdus methylotrophus TaxID=3242694 RepID=A0ABV4TT94_9GAMM